MNHIEELTQLRKTLQDREKTIEQLSLKAKWLDLIFDYAPINIYIKNNQGQLMAINKEFEKNFSVKAEQIIGNFPLHLSENELKLAQEHDQRIFSTRAASEQEETISGRVYRVIKHPIFDNEGKPTHIIGFDVDITDLNRSRQELMERNRELEAFSYTVAHDLKAPARRIKAFADILQEGHKENLNRDAMEIVVNISKSAGLLSGLIDDLLRMSQVGTGEIIFEPIDMDSFLANLARDVSGSDLPAYEDAIHIIGPFPTLKAHPLTIKMIFQNLFENALKFIAPGASPFVEVTATQTNECCTIAVKDNGIGIAEKHWDAIFGTFNRLHSSDTYPGTGIGLAIVQKGAKLHGGSAWVESQPGSGSTFFVSFPLIQTAR